MTIKASDGKSCPYCGGTSGAWVVERASGVLERDVAWNGRVHATDTDKLRERPAKFAECQDCRRRVRSPMPDAPK